jgi:hypothetical protein
LEERMTKKAFDKIAAGLRDALAMVQGKTLEWIPVGPREGPPGSPSVPIAPDPDYPDGKALDIARGRLPACSLDLPYPAQGHGMWEIFCALCGLKIGVTASGRPDDPRSVRFACRVPLNRQ